jgi:hypothetical protein
VLHWLHDHLQLGNVPMWVSGLAAAFSALFGYKSYRASKRAKGAQDEAAKQANLAVEAQNNIAEEIKRLGDDRARRREDEERAPWRIKKLARDDYLLGNLTPTSKYEVRLHGSAVRPNSRNYFREIGGNGSVEIDFYIRPEQHPDDLKVTWHPTRDHSGPAWEQPIQL